MTDDEIDDYALRRLADDALEQVESHLLVCDDCFDRVIETDALIDALRRRAEASWIGSTPDEGFDLTGHYAGLRGTDDHQRPALNRNTPRLKIAGDTGGYRLRTRK